jgi:hypothetical protein
MDGVRGKYCFIVCVALLALPIAGRTQKIRLSDTNSSVGHGYAPADHVPPALLAAKTVFLSNAGADSGLFPQPFTGDPNRGYAGLYAALQTSGKHELVDAPEKADLVLELRLIAPNGPSGANKQNGASDPLPMFRLTIYDQRTHYILWALTESIDVAILQKTHDRNFDQALLNLAYDFDQVTGKLPPPNPPASH